MLAIFISIDMRTTLPTSYGVRIVVVISMSLAIVLPLAARVGGRGYYNSRASIARSLAVLLALAVLGLRSGGYVASRVGIAMSLAVSLFLAAIGVGDGYIDALEALTVGIYA